MTLCLGVNLEVVMLLVVAVVELGGTCLLFTGRYSEASLATRSAMQEAKNLYAVREDVDQVRRDWLSVKSAEP